ncbi:glutathione S-transferase family protein [Vibrio hepatarius]|uniref:glutathione S-transferase family protein n=1 Tax=Vibrio hepatarius TaxID=171383 RepID=UPI00142DAE4E|nr:glutathione S-transferase family protein [Vibrio hepatarius]NIY82038.1 glutathione S-transferase [Vibrio hepatarius]
MKLYLNDTSPFSRVVLAAASLVEDLSIELVWVDPWQSPPNLTRANPFSIIPVLQLTDGTPLLESLCICQHLINRFKPLGLNDIDYAHTREVQVLGIAKTLMDVGFRTVALGRFTDGDNELIERGRHCVGECLQRLEKQLKHELKSIATKPTLATLYLHAALDYIVFRHSEAFQLHARENTATFLVESPFRQVLDSITPERLVSKPTFEHIKKAAL